MGIAAAESTSAPVGGGECKFLSSVELWGEETPRSTGQMVNRGLLLADALGVSMTDGLMCSCSCCLVSDSVAAKEGDTEVCTAEAWGRKLVTSEDKCNRNFCATKFAEHCPTAGFVKQGKGVNTPTLLNFNGNAQTCEDTAAAPVDLKKRIEHWIERHKADRLVRGGCQKQVFADDMEKAIADYVKGHDGMMASPREAKMRPPQVPLSAEQQTHMARITLCSLGGQTLPALKKGDELIVAFPTNLQVIASLTLKFTLSQDMWMEIRGTSQRRKYCLEAETDPARKDKFTPSERIMLASIEDKWEVPFAFHTKNDRGDAALPVSPVKVRCERAGEAAVKGDKGPLGKMWCQCNVENDEMIADEAGCTAGDRAELCRWDKSAEFCTVQGTLDAADHKKLQTQMKAMFTKPKV
jgi:hypothetical protein